MNNHQISLLLDYLDPDNFLSLSQSSESIRNSILLWISNVKDHFLFLAKTNLCKTSSSEDVIIANRKDLLDHHLSQKNTDLSNLIFTAARYDNKELVDYLINKSPFVQ